MQPFQVHNAQHQWNNCPDIRPWVLVEVMPDGSAYAFPVSSHCYGGYHCFELNPAHPEFGATGLTKLCHVHYQSLIVLPNAAFRRLRGP